MEVPKDIKTELIFKNDLRFFNFLRKLSFIFYVYIIYLNGLFEIHHLLSIIVQKILDKIKKITV